MKVSNVWKWWTVLVLGLIAFGVGWYRYDLVNEILIRDQTYMTSFMVVLAVITGLSTLGRTWNNWHEFITEIMTRLGFIGTIIGFMMALGAAGISENLETVDDVKNLVVEVMAGMSIAMTTTLAGLVLQLWLDFQKRSIKDD